VFFDPGPARTHIVTHISFFSSSAGDDPNELMKLITSFTSSTGDDILADETQTAERTVSLSEQSESMSESTSNKTTTHSPHPETRTTANSQAPRRWLIMDSGRATIEIKISWLLICPLFTGANHKQPPRRS
jgi:hypothetical protein